jgi:hypothetical protein
LFACWVRHPIIMAASNARSRRGRLIALLAVFFNLAPMSGVDLGLRTRKRQSDEHFRLRFVFVVVVGCFYFGSIYKGPRASPAVYELHFCTNAAPAPPRLFLTSLQTLATTCNPSSIIFHAPALFSSICLFGPTSIRSIHPSILLTCTRSRGPPPHSPSPSQARRPPPPQPSVVC